MFTYKEVVFYLACCTVCNNITLFSLFSFTICLALFSTTPFPLSLLFVVLCNGHTVAHHTIFILFFFFDFPPPLLCTVSFPSFSLCLSQCDGLSGWLLRCSWSLCKYIYLYSTASLLFSPCCLWAFKCEMAKNKPIEVFAFSTFRHLLFTLTQAFKGTKF